MFFRLVFVAVVLGTVLVVAAMLLHARRPRVELDQPTPALVVIVWLCPAPGLLVATWVVLAVESLVGIAGFILYVTADPRRAPLPLADRIIFGAPVFAPLLFVDLALLGGIASLARARVAVNR